MSERPSLQQTAQAYADARQRHKELEDEIRTLQTKRDDCAGEVDRHATTLLGRVGRNVPTRVFVCSPSLSVVVRHEGGVELVPIGE